MFSIDDAKFSFIQWIYVCVKTLNWWYQDFFLKINSYKDDLNFSYYNRNVKSWKVIHFSTELHLILYISRKNPTISTVNY